MKVEDNFLVQLHGSGLVGYILGQDPFLDTHLILSKLRDSGKLECFKWWCPTCNKDPESLKINLMSHLYSISFTTAKKIISNNQVTWKWANPQSEWAKAKGLASQAAQELISSKSRPKWKVIIAYKITEMRN